jgi:centromeric protein E
MEIYNEQVIDLLSKDLHVVNIFQDNNKNISFDNLTEEIVVTEEDAMAAISKGEGFRKVAKTFANDRSSRSHTIFRMVVESKSENSVVKIGNLNLVDLAGSETATQNTDQLRLKESKNINLSLLHLKDCITKLSKGEKYA